MLTGLLFAIGGMLLNSVAGLLQSDASRRVSRTRPLIVQPGYLAGLLADGLGWACTVVALRHLPVFAVQGVLGGSIAVTAVAARLLYGSALRKVGRVAIGLCLVGVVLVASSAGTHQSAVTSTTAYVVLCLAAVLLIVGVAVLWRYGHAWPLAVLAGLGFGGTALAVRAVHVGMHSGLADVLAQPSVYLVVCFWVIGLTSYSRALQLGSLARVTAVFQVTEVVVPGLVGIMLLDDQVRAGWWAPMVAGLLLAVLGVGVLAGWPAWPRPAARVH